MPCPLLRQVDTLSRQLAETTAALHASRREAEQLRAQLLSGQSDSGRSYGDEPHSNRSDGLSYLHLS